MNLDILYVNDAHGYMQEHPELFYNQFNPYIVNTGGYARIATIIKQINRNNRNILLLDGGDTFHGTYPVVDTKGQLLIPVLNKLGFDAMVGHWDFGYGPSQLKFLLDQLNYPMLGINVYREDGSLFLPPYKIIERDYVKIGLIGICSNIIDKTMPKQFSEGIRVTDGIAELPGVIQKVKDAGADIVMLLSHNGMPQDVYTLENVSGIDVCLSAHTHNRLFKSIRVKNSILIQCGCHCSFLGHLRLDIEKHSILSHQYQLIPLTENITPDPEIGADIAKSMRPYEQLKKEIAGHTSSLLHRYDTLNSSMDYLLLSAAKSVANTTISFSNGWRYGVPICPGAISKWDLYNIVPMNPPISIVKLTGAEIIEMLEENLERTFSPHPMKQMGGYVKRCVGLKANIRIENPKGHRIQEIYIGNDHINTEKYYPVSFITSQGVPPGYGIERKELSIKAMDAMVDFLSTITEFDSSEYRSFRLI